MDRPVCTRIDSSAHLPHAAKPKVFLHCEYCGEALGDIRADDGPAWATILVVVGHLTVPFFLIAARADASAWIIFGVLVPATVALTAILLQRLKGVFVSVLWSLNMRSGAPS